MRANHKREVLMLITLLLIFALLFMIGLLGLRRGYAIFGTGLGISVENYLVMLLSFGSIVRVVYLLIKH